MPRTPDLSIPYDLGFKVDFAPAGIWSTGADVHVLVELANDVSDAAFQECDSLATTFFMLASTRALSGEHIDPHRSGIGDRELVSRGRRRLHYVFRRCVVDRASTILCANAFSLAHRKFPIQSIVIDSAPTFTGATSSLVLDSKATDPYPGMYTPLPFPCDFDPDQDSPLLTLELEEPPADEKKAEDNILTWAAASAGGVYAAVLTPPSDCFMSIDPSDLEISDDDLTFAIGKFRCHEAALRGLVNACAALHPNVLRIANAAIE
jgi:hypothetical protein